MKKKQKTFQTNFKKDQTESLEMKTILAKMQNSVYRTELSVQD